MRYKPYAVTLILGFLSLFLVAAMVRHPQIAFDAALRGLKIWWDIVFPALLPFMITAEVMMGFGVVHFVGVLLEPIMRPLFNVPGTGGFVMAMGLSSGYPVGPKLATRLREQNLVSRAEGERLVCFTSTSDPLFIFGAVAVGFFHDASLGVSIAIANYSGAILLGVLLKYHDRHSPITFYQKARRYPILVRAFQAMHQARIKDQRPIGKLLGEAVMSSFHTLFVIGGFIIIFSVMIKFVTSGLLAEILMTGLSLLLMALHIPQELSETLAIGFFEVTQSMQNISELNHQISMEIKIAFASGLVAWGGISVHAQVASIISTTDMRYKPYFVYKFIHAIMAGVIAYFIYKPLLHVFDAGTALPAIMRKLPEGRPSYILEAFQNLGFHALLLLFLLLCFSLYPLLLKKSR